MKHKIRLDLEECPAIKEAIKLICEKTMEILK